MKQITKLLILPSILFLIGVTFTVAGVFLYYSGATVFPLPINGESRLVAVKDVVTYGVDGQPPCLSHGRDGACYTGYEYSINTQDGDTYRLSSVFNTTFENNTDHRLKESWIYARCSYMSPSSKDTPHTSGDWDISIDNRNYFFGCDIV